jgi:hypothetical protein
MQKPKKIIECALHLQKNKSLQLNLTHSCHLNHQDGLEFYKYVDAKRLKSHVSLCNFSVFTLKPF